MEEKEKIFEAHFYGQMSAGKTIEFERNLNTNDELNAAYQLYRSIQRAATDVQKDRLRAQIDGVIIEDQRESATAESSPPAAKIYTLLKSVIAVAALLIVGFWGYSVLQKPTVDTLFAQNFEVYQPQQSRGISEDLPVLDQKNINTPELKLYYATTLLRDNQSQAAITYLMEVPDESTFRDQKYWYLGLAHLKDGNIKQAKDYFTHLSSITNYKKQELNEIISALKNH